jgi:hypothetical protein
VVNVGFCQAIFLLLQEGFSILRVIRLKDG